MGSSILPSSRLLERLIASQLVEERFRMDSMEKEEERERHIDGGLHELCVMDVVRENVARLLQPKSLSCLKYTGRISKFTPSTKSRNTRGNTGDMIPFFLLMSAM